MSFPHDANPSLNLYFELSRHLPPSASVLRLWALDALTASYFSEHDENAGRFEVIRNVPPATSLDAVAGIRDTMPASDELALYLQTLRRGGRLILLITPDYNTANETVEMGQVLERAGYVRILAEHVGGATLVRGEKVHETNDTLARVRGVANADQTTEAFTPLDTANYNGRFVFLLTQSQTNRRPWETGEPANADLTAIAIMGTGENNTNPPIALAFSSLPKAVAFMQPMILAGRIAGVNKIAKFTRGTASTWPFPAWLNPPLDALDRKTLASVRVDASSAITGDE